MTAFPSLFFLSFFAEKKPLKVTLTEGKQRIAVRHDGYIKNLMI